MPNRWTRFIANPPRLAVAAVWIGLFTLIHVVLALLARSSSPVSRADSFAQCQRLCGAVPVEVRWSESGQLVACRCDLMLPDEPEAPVP